LSSHETVRVDLGPRGYDIVVGDDVLAEAGKTMAPILRQPRVIVVTDDRSSWSPTIMWRRCIFMR
jgi:3-dehydroquinate synthase